ncbi:hypothetical protein FAF44_44480 [Nonomuraea sp. MG754425]|nr:hypothetical protein [Nonomuraea sp. MG754425]
MSLVKIFDQWPECSTISPRPDSTWRCTRSTTSSDTSAWAAWPHQVSTSVPASASSVSPCSGSSRVAVRTVARPPSRSATPRPMAWCMPSG